jgi:hypothetical protein
MEVSQKKHQETVYKTKILIKEFGCIRIGKLNTYLLSNC